ncbi:hypothetical protein EDC18_11021 [Natranaerovirga pectinivora]|uniref:Uncharacterized protein n=1 Tax=Natranaerovirga pectinivora TaxID=682400 RepID=A0A4R3MG98_9FIRM|nr:hypothetical protein [Natranaerovirga pectinivora]TCT12947.1 hypothetical protein EDC18_11021 [Natranaerovirga pectinivora]
MKRKLFSSILLIILISSLFSCMTYASAGNTQASMDAEAFLEFFQIDESILFDTVSNAIESERSINNFKYFRLIQGFSRYVNPTFSSQRYLVGEGEPGTSIGIMVYSIRNENIVVQNQLRIQTIGASGLFNRMLFFNNIGDNNVLIAVRKNNETIYKRFVVNRKAEETKQRLEVLDIRLFSL